MIRNPNVIICDTFDMNLMKYYSRHVFNMDECEVHLYLTVSSCPTFQEHNTCYGSTSYGMRMLRRVRRVRTQKFASVFPLPVEMSSRNSRQGSTANFCEWPLVI
jgi:hypothetical protein